MMTNTWYRSTIYIEPQLGLIGRWRNKIDPAQRKVLVEASSPMGDSQDREMEIINNNKATHTHGQTATAGLTKKITRSKNSKKNREHTRTRESGKGQDNALLVDLHTDKKEGKQNTIMERTSPPFVCFKSKSFFFLFSVSLESEQNSSCSRLTRSVRECRCLFAFRLFLHVLPLLSWLCCSFCISPTTSSYHCLVFFFFLSDTTYTHTSHTQKDIHNKKG